jgi:hypothetical protein
MTDTEDIARIQAELLAAFNSMREDLRKAIRARVGHDLEFVLVAWDRTRVNELMQVPTVYQIYTLNTPTEAIQTAVTVLENVLAKPETPAGADVVKLH